MRGSLSGGEQQMLCIGRALMPKPKLLLLDEPSLGLAPLIVKLIFELIQRIRSEGTSILLVEQNARAALKIADYGYVMEGGRIILEGTGAELAADDRVMNAYLGGKPSWSEQFDADRSALCVCAQRQVLPRSRIPFMQPGESRMPWQPLLIRPLAFALQSARSALPTRACHSVVFRPGRQPATPALSVTMPWALPACCKPSPRTASRILAARA